MNNKQLLSLEAYLAHPERYKPWEIIFTPFDYTCFSFLYQTGALPDVKEGEELFFLCRYGQALYHKDYDFLRFSLAKLLNLIEKKTKDAYELFCHCLKSDIFFPLLKAIPKPFMTYIKSIQTNI